MIFAVQVENPAGLLCLGFLLLLIVTIVLIHWTNRQPAPEIGQWRGTQYVDAPTIAGYLVDADTKLPYIFISQHALSQRGSQWVIDGKCAYKAEADADHSLKLIRSGTGFRVYGKNDIEGKWLPCR